MLERGNASRAGQGTVDAHPLGHESQVSRGKVRKSTRGHSKKEKRIVRGKEGKNEDGFEGREKISRFSWGGIVSGKDIRPRSSLGFKKKKEVIAGGVESLKEKDPFSFKRGGGGTSGKMGRGKLSEKGGKLKLKRLECGKEGKSSIVQLGKDQPARRHRFPAEKKLLSL